jgi:hypothetical protein
VFGLPVNPLVFLGLYALVCVGALVAGVRMSRGAPPEGVTADQARRFGRLLMMAATAMILFLVAIIVHGDLKVTT